MSKGGKPPRVEYDVGYGKPPRHSQFVPGQSGNKGRSKKKPLESTAKMLERNLQEEVEVNGRKMAKYELGFQMVLNRTIKSGTMGDWVKLNKMLADNGVNAQLDRNEERWLGAEESWAKLQLQFQRHFNIDSADRADGHRRDIEEAKVVMGCDHCGPKMRERWQDADYKALVKRGVRSHLHSTVMGWTDQEMKLRVMEEIPRDKPQEDET